MSENQEIQNELIKIGHVSEAHGLRGDLYVLVHSGDTSWLKDIEVLTLINPFSKKQPPKIFHLKSAKPFKKGFICKLEGIENRNQSEELERYEVWIPKNTFVSKSGEQPYLVELQNFLVIDETLKKEIGRITSFSSNGSQDLLILDQAVNEQPIEIPFVKQFVIEIDFEKKILRMQLPEGLLSINEKD